MMARLFIGIPIESFILEKEVNHWRNEPFLNSNLLKWVEPENWHMTLFFLGNQDISAISLLQQILEESFCKVQSFIASANLLGVFPSQSDPKVLWIGIDNLQLLLPGYLRMGELLLQNGFTFNNKPLTPHLTLARIKRLATNDSFESFLTKNRELHFGSFAISRVVLFESILNVRGSIYKPLYFKLLGSDQEETM